MRPALHRLSHTSSSSQPWLAAARMASTMGTAAMKFDVAVIGGGPGGYVAALKAAKLGLKAACIEKREWLGGTCLNEGCIPSKSLLHISHRFHEAKTGKALGILVEDPRIDVAAMMKAKISAMQPLRQGVDGLLKKNKVERFRGVASFVNATTLSIAAEGREPVTLEAEHFIIASGSEPSPPGGGLKVDGRRIVDSTGALELQTVPKRMIVVGAGAIGLELGSVWSRLGASVEVIEFFDRIVPALDADVSVAYKKILEKQGLKFRLSSAVTASEVTEDEVTLTVTKKDGGGEESVKADVVLVAVGRRPVTAGLNLEVLGVAPDERGFIPTEEGFSVKGHSHIKAIGDATRGAMLAHRAEDEGIAVAEVIAKAGDGHINYEAIPNVIYTHPEVASVGQSEDKLKESGVSYRKATFPLAANSRARATLDTDGLVKVMTGDDDKLLGATVVAAAAGEMIHELTLAVEYGASSEDIARTSHAHPTLSEAIREACMAVRGQAIHM